MSSLRRGQLVLRPWAEWAECPVELGTCRFLLLQTSQGCSTENLSVNKEGYVSVYYVKVYRLLPGTAELDGRNQTQISRHFFAELDKKGNDNIDGDGRRTSDSSEKTDRRNEEGEAESRIAADMGDTGGLSGGTGGGWYLARPGSVFTQRRERRESGRRVGRTTGRNNTGYRIG